MNTPPAATRLRLTLRAETAADLMLREVERRHVWAVLEQEKGNKVHAAKALGISRRALYRLIDKYRLEGPPYQNACHNPSRPS